MANGKTGRGQWFPEARFGLLFNWGPFAALGRGEQALFREHHDQREYAERARNWNSGACDMKAWARLAKESGAKYAVFSARGHDGYCLWNTVTSKYNSVKQAPQRDFVAEFLDAFRSEGLKTGLYYSLADWRVPAYWEGPRNDAHAWGNFRNSVHKQVRELATKYGDVNLFWFDAAWPHSADRWMSLELIDMLRDLQHGIIVNNRLGHSENNTTILHRNESGGGMGDSRVLGDFSVMELHKYPETVRMWETAVSAGWRGMGHVTGGGWRDADGILDNLLECAGRGGNLLLGCGPDGDGKIPAPLASRLQKIGRWMKTHGESVYGSEPGEVCDFSTTGRQTKKGNKLYLAVRFWDKCGVVRLAGLETRVLKAELLTNGQNVDFKQDDDILILEGLPAKSPAEMFPVIRLECDGAPVARPWAVDRLGSGHPRRMAPWSAAGYTEI